MAEGRKANRRKRRGPNVRRVRALLRTRRVRLALRWLGLALLALVVVGLGTVEVYGHRAGPAHAPVEIEIAEGSSLGDVASLLADSELVSNRWLVSSYLRLSTDGAELVPGRHLLIGGRSPSELRDLLIRSPARPKVKVTIPEGFHRFSIADRLEGLGVTGKRAFLGATTDPILLSELGVPASPGGGAPESAEGYLFPATYELSLDTDADEVLRVFVAESNKRWDRLVGSHADALVDLEKRLGFGRREVMILASIIEKEAAKPDERPIIASVFLNRLTDPTFTPHRLQSDPTSGYGCLVAQGLESCVGYEGKITPKMNQDKQNRYSTYVIEGLPPGPISNPGMGSISAVLEPAMTKFLFFVAKGGGRHTFSETYDEHQRAIHGEH